MTHPGRRTIWLRRATVIAVAAAVIGATFLLARSLIGSRLREKEAYRIEVAESAKGRFLSKIEKYVKKHPRLKVVDKGGSPDLLIDIAEREGYGSTVIGRKPAVRLVAGDVSKTLGKGGDYYLLFKQEDRFTRNLAGFLKESTPRVSLTACGDIVPGRRVAERMAQHGVMYPFEKIAPYIHGADILLGNLECPLSDRVAPPYSGMSFVAPSETLEGIKLCGFDVVTLANNHSTNFGRDVFSDTLKLLEENGIEYVGGGVDSDAAHSPAYTDVKGVRFAFLGYNAVAGALDAGPGRAGVANIRLLPWFKDDPEDFDRVGAAVREARKEADVVVACFHWGAEEVYYPNDSVRKMARTACDAGADIVIGTHPHSVQPLEYYDGKLIAYSLGNFVFDQMFSTQVREGVVMKCLFEGSDLSKVELVPYTIYDFCQPAVMTGRSGQYLLDHVLEISKMSG